MKIIGINYLHSDSSCSLIINNEVVAAVEEERYKRTKTCKRRKENSRHCVERGQQKDIETQE